MAQSAWLFDGTGNFVASSGTDGLKLASVLAKLTFSLSPNAGSLAQIVDKSSSGLELLTAVMVVTVRRRPSYNQYF